MMTRYSKPLLLLLFSGCSFLYSFAQDVTLASQAEVDAFNSATTTINGNLTIETTSTTDPITDLSNLLNLTLVTGYLSIRNNDALTDLDGLTNISAIGGYVIIAFNTVLTNLDGLANLSAIGGNLAIASNAALTNLDGLANLSAIGEVLNISLNAALTNLDGLANLSSIGGDLYISLNAALTNLDGLANISAIGGYLQIIDNDALTNLDGLMNLSSIGEYLQISGNDALTNLDGLANLSTIAGNLAIASNAALTNLDGLANLSAIGGDLFIGINPALTNLDGLANLSAVGGVLNISLNAVLTNLDGLISLSSIGGDLYIHINDALTNLDGLANLSSIGGGLFIDGNATLTNCCAIQDLLSTPNAIGGDILIFNNPSACSSPEEIIAAPCTTMEIAINVPCIGANNGSIQVQITGGIAPFTYTWERQEDGQVGNGGSSNPDFIIESLGAGTYNLTVINAAGTVIQENVTVIGLPSTNEALTFETCTGQPIEYNGVSLSVGEQRTFTFENSYGCDSLITVIVNRNALDDAAFVPTVFSPNDDGINDCFEVYTQAGLVYQKYKMQIFDHWGGLVFSSTDPDSCWNGDVRGKPAPMGVYIWFLEMETQACAALQVLKGDVTLIR